MGMDTFLRAGTFGLVGKDPADKISPPTVQQQDPAPIKESGSNKQDLMRKRKKSGRASTVVTGELAPSTEQRSLLASDGMM